MQDSHGMCKTNAWSGASCLLTDRQIGCPVLKQKSLGMKMDCSPMVMVWNHIKLQSKI
uniref:Uncharacterized protein n=1 Tax=Anguilla anguilla TaxID=7936 RepID=A0A0E9UEX3_ANGAN